jgi:acyl-CoA reductase-like NAD-dependent aldehyde dehydrogenase
VLPNVSKSALVTTEETFGPLASVYRFASPVYRFASEDDVISSANRLSSNFYH